MKRGDRGETRMWRGEESDRTREGSISRKERETKEDSRYIIFYSFEDKGEDSGEDSSS